MDKIDVMFISAIILVLGGFALAIGDFAWHHYQDTHAKEDIQSKREGWEPPVIPSCNKELWERIKDRCGDQLDEGED